ncbi:MAG: hypothetical protein VB093_07500 [Propionicimonas sp.]|nr:hypothetical protein [Propionicimonas sp.]
MRLHIGRPDALSRAIADGAVFALCDFISHRIRDADFYADVERRAGRRDHGSRWLPRRE